MAVNPVPVPMGTRVLSSCGQTVGTVYQLSTMLGCPDCGEVRVGIRWPDGKQRDYCRLGIMLEPEGFSDSPLANFIDFEAILMRGYRIKEAS